MVSFKAWLNGHRHAQTAIGDLARDAAQDPNWPRTSSLKRLVAHLDDMGAIDRAIDTLRRAHQEYEEEKLASPSR
ncbi:YozE family protein [Streptomyces sp. NPDC058268]|uniref:YozE family protein n=2 Tax=unclassified Streptomyces TaxID=2593676 RepID=UPI0036F11296